MASDPQDTYVQLLTANLQRAIDYLKFAEAKNAALLALASAWIGATLSLEASGRPLPAGFTLSISIMLFCALCAGVMAMVALLPQLHLPTFLGGRRAGPHAPNLLYFGDISSLTIKSLEVELPGRYLPDGGGYRPEYVHDLTVQLMVNSEIAMRKMSFFNIGMRFMLLAGAILLLSAVRLLFTNVRGLW